MLDGVGVGVGDTLGVGVAVGCAVSVGAGLGGAVGIGVAELDGVGIGVALGTGGVVADGVAVGSGVGVEFRTSPSLLEHAVMPQSSATHIDTCRAQAHGQAVTFLLRSMTLFSDEVTVRTTE